MNPAFAGPEFGDEFDDEEASQLTLGTTSLLSIFFGVVMICGIFFGLGYTFGRRSFAQIAMQKPAPVSVPARKVIAAPAPPLPATQTAQSISSPPSAVQPSVTQSALQQSAIQKTQPLANAALSSTATKPAPVTATASAAKAPVPPALAVSTAAASSKTVATATSAPLLAKQADAKPPVPVATLLAKKMFLPKPSAIQPVLIQPRTNVAYLHGVPMPPNPYEAAQLPWKWTPPFDVVHPSSSHTRLSRPRDARLNSPSAAHANAMQTNSAPPDQASALPSAHSAVVIQIAALSRQDDAQVLTDALRKHGFPASIHNGNDDTLYHVEMGPLERRTALAAQQRLIARGYNATVKQ
jgi:hypothetical protein